MKKPNPSFHRPAQEAAQAGEFKHSRSPDVGLNRGNASAVGISGKDDVQD